MPAAGAVSDGADLHELLSESGWYRKPSAITGWLGIHHVVYSQEPTSRRFSKQGLVTMSYWSTVCTQFLNALQLSTLAISSSLPAVSPAKLTKAIARVGGH
jgi:hypothetical protein